MENKTQSRLAMMQEAISKATGPRYTFATQKTRGGRFMLLVKRKDIQSMNYYGYVADENNNIIKFKTKVSAHNAAEKIDNEGLEKCNFTLVGEVYE